MHTTSLAIISFYYLCNLIFRFIYYISILLFLYLFVRVYFCYIFTISLVLTVFVAYFITLVILFFV